MEETSGIMEGLLALPKGGGSLKSLGECFEPDLLRGTGNYSIPLEAPKGSNGLSPKLSLRYSTGQGNGPYGMGWRLIGPLEIRRRTDRGVPSYNDEADEFILSGTEPLVSVGNGKFRPRSDTLFWDIRRNGNSWLIRTKDGRSYSLGSSSNSCIFDGNHTFAWLVDQETDSAGNTIKYKYFREGSNLYLSQVDWSIYRWNFEYETRQDPLREGRAGFPIFTNLRCHTINRYCPKLPQPLLAQYSLTYFEAEGSRLSLLSEIRLTGFDENNQPEEAPATSFQYSQHLANRVCYSRLSSNNLTPLLDEPGTVLVDMDGDGLPEILQTEDHIHHCWPNRGNGQFGSIRSLPVPSGMRIGAPGISFIDINGDGTADMLNQGNRLSTAVANTGTGNWARRAEVFRQQPTVQISNSKACLIDLDGDGVLDLLESSQEGFLISYYKHRKGWSQPQSIRRIHNVALFPDLNLDSTYVRLADMDGDGLADIVHLDNGRVEYWPSLAKGRWDKRVRMKNAPKLPRNYDSQRLYLCDLDGDGTTDIIYIDFDRVFYWLNQSGISWSKRYKVPFVPTPNQSAIQMADVLGTGVRGVLWSSSSRRNATQGYHFLDLNGGVKPYLLERIDNGVGCVTELHYSTTTAMRQADEKAGKPWHTYLPFPLQVVEELTQADIITGNIKRTKFSYHRGYYDGYDHEFRGFENVEMRVEGDAHSPTIVQQTTFSLGSVDGPLDVASLPTKVKSERRALGGCPIQVVSYEITPDGTSSIYRSAQIHWNARIEFESGDQFVHFPHMVDMETHDIGQDSPDRIDTATYTYDKYGNLISRRRKARFANQPETEALITEQHMTYTTNESAWLVGLPATVEERDSAGRLLRRTEHYYDGQSFIGLPLGQATAGLVRRTRELTLADWALPINYASHIDDSFGLIHDGEGFYREVNAVEHDSSGNVTQMRDPKGHVKIVQYDSDSLFPLHLTDPMGQVTTAQFDPRTAQPLELVLPDGRKTRYEYTPLGRLRAQYDTASDGSLQLTQIFDYNNGDFVATSPQPARVASIRPLSSGVSLSQFDQIDDLSALSGVSIACDYYDSDGNLLQRIRRAPNKPDGQPRFTIGQRRRYSVRGQPAADFPNEFTNTLTWHPEIPSGKPVLFFYDASGNLRRIEQPDGSHFRMRRLPDRIEKWNPDVPDEGPPIIERFDALNRKIEVIQPTGSGSATITRYKMDIVGRITQITDATNRVISRYTYGGPGPAIRIEHADAGVRTYWRDGSELLRLRTDSLERRLVLEYDALGRQTKAIDASNPTNLTQIRTFIYQNGRLTEVNEGSLKESFQYDAAGRITHKKLEFSPGSILEIKREYGFSGELRAIVYPNGTRVEYGYDESAMMRNASGFVDNIEYDAHGRPIAIHFKGSSSAHYTFDPLLPRLEKAELRNGTNLIRSMSMKRDIIGNIDYIFDEMPDETMIRRFTYDQIGRLTQAEMRQGENGPVWHDYKYEYTLAGDITRNDEALIGTNLYDDAAHSGRLTQVQLTGTAEPVTLQYDTAGRMIDFGNMHNLVYDMWDRLVSGTLQNGTTVGFQYDHQGRRVRKTVETANDTFETRYAEKLYEIGPNGERLNVYLDRLLVAVKTDKTACILTDDLGSVIASCSPTGDRITQQIYSPFGLSLRPSGPNRYIGIKGDSELGLIQLGARYYSPVLARFITPDWYVIENPSHAGTIPQGLNAYSYCINNPLIFRDPSGLFFFLFIAVAAIVGFVAGTIYGLATGKSFGESLLVGLEAGLLGAAGAALGVGAIAGLAGIFGASVVSGLGLYIAVGAGVIGGLNGIISGMTQIYDWTSWKGWIGFLGDSSWGLVGTTMGLFLHFYNQCAGAKYNSDLSRRQNRHVYEGGFHIKDGFVFTQGNVISNFTPSGNEADDQRILNHETLHVWQSRLFGPIFQTTYVAWLAVGFLVACVYSGFTEQSFSDDVMDIAYFNNPWEVWAYTKNPGEHGGDLSWSNSS